MTRKRKLLIIAAAVPVLLVTMALLYVNFADLSGWRDTVAGMISDSLGRELTINGVFEPDIGLTTSVVVGDIALANADWSSEPIMVSIDRLAFEVELLSLLFGPIRIHSLELDGANVLLEVADDGRGNWEFDTEDDETDSEPLDIRLDRLAVNNLRLRYRDATLDEPLDLLLTRLESVGDDDDMQELSLTGVFAEQDLAVAGRIGTLSGLLDLGAIEHDLAGHLGEIEFKSSGRIAELTTLNGADFVAEVRGDDLIAAGKIFGLRGIGSGPFRVTAGVSPSAAGFDLDLDAAFGGINAEVTGTVDVLLDPQILDLSVSASGPSIRSVGALTGVADLPDEAFTVSGGVRWEGFPITFREVKITVGDNTLSADGVLGAPPAMMGTDFTFHGDGPDISSIAALVGVSLPKDSFSVSGRLVRLEQVIGVQKIEARVGRTILEVDGTVGDPPSYAGTALRFHGEGPNLAHFQSLAGIELPAERFEIDGKLVQGEGAITLEGISARVGRTTLQVDGHVKTEKGFSGTSLLIRAKGPDAARMAGLAGISEVPAEAWTVDGGFSVLDSAYHLEGMTATLGSLTVHADGRVVAANGLVGTDLKLHIEDPDLSHPASLAGITGLPSLPLRIDGRLRVVGAGYRLDGVTASAGDIDVEIAGLIGAAKNLEGTRVHMTARGPRLSSLEPYLHQSGLPPAPFSVAGDLHVTGGAYELDTLVAEVDRNRVTLSGTVLPVEGLVGTDLQIEINIPDLGRAGHLAAGFADLPDLPAEPFSVKTRLRIDEAGYEIEDLRATLANAVAAVDGRIGRTPDLVGTDLTIDADGPNASLFTAVSGVTIPVAPFKVRGRFQRTDGGFHFDRVSVQLGDYRAAVNGSLGEPPRWIGTDLELRASGPGLALFRELTGVNALPDEEFRIAGRFKGTPELFTADGLEIVVGDSDLKGSLEVDIRGKPAVTVRISSNNLNLAPYLSHLKGGSDGDVDQTAASETPKDRLVFSNEPFDFGPLRQADADVEVTIGSLQLPVNLFREVTIGARLADGRLEVHRFAMVGQREGRGSGTLVLEPVGDEYRLYTVFDLDAIRLDPPVGDPAAAASEPPIDLDVRLEALGNSPHSFASSANGSVQVVIGKGVMMDNKALDFVTADILLTLLNAFNPFAKTDEATELQCGVALVSIENGLATLEPMVLQSDKMTMLGKGKIDFGTEKLSLDWVTKPRKGIGVSASMITNPYIKLGGTLSNPSVQLKGAQAVASTGVAVATLGLSVLAKGMLDRITAEKKVCKWALEEIGRQSDDTSKKSKKKRRKK